MGMRIGACIATGLLLVPPIVAATELPKYEVVDLGTLADRGTVAEGRSRAFRVRAGQPMIDLGTFGGGNSVAQAINNAGQITGGAEDANGGLRAFVAGSGQPMVALEALGGPAIGQHINAAGRVAGRYQVGSPDLCFTAAAGSASIGLGTLGATRALPPASTTPGT